MWNKVYIDPDKAKLSVDETLAKQAVMRVQRKDKWSPGRKYNETVDVYGTKVFLTIIFDEEDNVEILNAKQVKGRRWR